MLNLKLRRMIPLKIKTASNMRLLSALIVFCALIFLFSSCNNTSYKIVHHKNPIHLHEPDFIKLTTFEMHHASYTAIGISNGNAIFSVLQTVDGAQITEIYRSSLTDGTTNLIAKFKGYKKVELFDSTLVVSDQGYLGSIDLMDANLIVHKADLIKDATVQSADSVFYVNGNFYYDMLIGSHYNVNSRALWKKDLGSSEPTRVANLSQKRLSMLTIETPSFYCVGGKIYFSDSDGGSVNLMTYDPIKDEIAVVKTEASSFFHYIAVNERFNISMHIDQKDYLAKFVSPSMEKNLFSLIIEKHCVIDIYEMFIRVRAGHDENIIGFCSSEGSLYAIPDQRYQGQFTYTPGYGVIGFLTPEMLLALFIYLMIVLINGQVD